MDVFLLHGGQQYVFGHSRDNLQDGEKKNTNIKLRLNHSIILKEL
jgi:hypothetical protein